MLKSDALAIALAEAIEKETKQEEKYGAEPDRGSVIAFNVRFRKEGPLYSYAAIRAGNLWYTTGPNAPERYTWGELTDWLDGVFKVKNFVVLR